VRNFLPSELSFSSVRWFSTGAHETTSVSILASAAFKFVTTSMLPETPYVTIIDELNYFVILQQAVILVLVCILLLQGRAHVAKRRRDARARHAVRIRIGAFIVLYSMRFLLAHSQRESLLRGIDAAYERYFPDAA
jgi:accessory gene regulator protein AgrB